MFWTFLEARIMWRKGAKPWRKLTLCTNSLCLLKEKFRPVQVACHPWNSWSIVAGGKRVCHVKFRLFSTWKLPVEYFCKQQTYSHKCQALITKPHIFGRIYRLLTYLRSSIAAPRAFINLSYSTPTVQGFIVSFNLIALPHASFEGQGMRVLPI